MVIRCLIGRFARIFFMDLGGPLPGPLFRSAGGTGNLRQIPSSLHLHLHDFLVGADYFIAHLLEHLEGQIRLLRG